MSKENIKERIKSVPLTPGVYIYKDNLGQVIYVGKAISLRKRMSQYFQNSKKYDQKTKALVDNIDDFEYVKAGSEMEAFILESNLIKKYKPKYNVLLRDDKTYPYIVVTTKEDFPRVIKTRTIKKDGNKYFGPFSDINAVNQMVDFINDVFSLKRCNRTLFSKSYTPCLNYHIKKCDSICSGEISKEEYSKKIDDVIGFLRGKDKRIDGFLKEKMEKASENLNFEEAARYRDYLLSAKSLREKQRVVLKGIGNIDVVLPVGKNSVVVFSVSDSKLCGRESYHLENDFENETTLVFEFIRQHYVKYTKGPDQILIKSYNDTFKLLEEYLGEYFNKKVKIYEPQKGEKHDLLKMAIDDMEEQEKLLMAKKERTIKREEKLSKSLEPFVGELKNPRIEAYDISNINGVDSVGVSIVFDGLNPDKKSYKKFKVKTAYGPDDYGSMQEVVFRRLKRAKEGDKGFLPLPDIILVDGGKGHLTSIEAVIKALGISIPIIGMAKDDNHRTKSLVYRKGDILEFSLEEDPFLFSFIGKVQEEVHRFAITYHRKLREKGITKSELENIKGIGRTKRNYLLNHFGSLKKVSEASISDLEQVKKLTKADILEIAKHFHIER